MKPSYYGSMVMGLLMCYTLQSQYYFSKNYGQEPELLWEAGVSAGAMNCLTDIGGKNGTGKKFIKDINLNQTQLCGSLFVSAAWHNLFAIRLEAAMGDISGNDNVLKNTTGIARSRYFRNLQFRTIIKELTVLGELYPLVLTDKNSEATLLSPYIIAGAGFFNYNPQAWVNNTWVDLRPLHTEGEGFKEYPDRKEYKSISWCLPVGAGIKYDAAGLIILRFEILYRFTGTDYLDDVSKTYVDPSLFGRYLSATQARQATQLADRSAEITAFSNNNTNAIRGNSKNKDAYFSCSFKISIALGRAQGK